MSLSGPFRRAQTCDQKELLLQPGILCKDFVTLDPAQNGTFVNLSDARNFVLDPSHLCLWWGCHT